MVIRETCDDCTAPRMTGYEVTRHDRDCPKGSGLRCDRCGHYVYYFKNGAFQCPCKEDKDELTDADDTRLP